MKMYRQGDVLLVAISPAISKSIKPGRDLREEKTGRTVLAYGEVTGHAHVVEHIKDGVVELFENLDSSGAFVLLRVSGRTAKLKHDEHETISLPPGDYRVIRQREYSPEAIRNVAD